MRVLNGWPEQAIKQLLRSEHHQADIEPGHVTSRLTRECFTRRTSLARADEHDVWQRERVLKLPDHPLGPVCRILDTFLALLVTQLPKQQEGHEYERDSQQDFWLDNMQEMEDERDRSRRDTRDSIPIVAAEPVFSSVLLHYLPFRRRHGVSANGGDLNEPDRNTAARVGR